VWVECDERSGVVQIHDPRLFRPGLESFCRALAEAAVQNFGAVRVEICVKSSMCRIEFGPGELDRAEIVRRLAASVRVATSAMQNRDGCHRGVQEECAITRPAAATETGKPIEQTEHVRPESVTLENALVPTEQPAGASDIEPRMADLVWQGEH
jgi:hypothetical protein